MRNVKYRFTNLKHYDFIQEIQIDGQINAL